MPKINYNQKAENMFRRLLREERQLPYDGSAEKLKKLTPAEHRRRIELQQRKDLRFKMLYEDGTYNAST